MQKNWSACALLFFSLSLLPLKAFSVEYSPEDITNLQRPIEESISLVVLTQKDIAKCPDCRLADFLNKVKVQTQTHPETRETSVVFSDIPENQILLLVNGIQQEDNTLPSSLTEDTPAHHIKYIEIVKGPSDLSSPIKGVIYITTKTNCFPGGICSGTRASLNVPNISYTNYNNTGFEINRSVFKQEVHNYSRSHHTMNTQPDTSIENDADNWGKTFYIFPNIIIDTSMNYNREEQPYRDPNTTQDKPKHYDVSIQASGIYHFRFFEETYSIEVGVGYQGKHIESEVNNVYNYELQGTDSVFTNITGNQEPFTYEAGIYIVDLSKYIQSGNIQEQFWRGGGAVSYYIEDTILSDVFLIAKVETGFHVYGPDGRYLRSFKFLDGNNIAYYENPSLKGREFDSQELGLETNTLGLSVFHIQSTLEKKEEENIYGGKLRIGSDRWRAELLYMDKSGEGEKIGSTFVIGTSYNLQYGGIEATLEQRNTDNNTLEHIIRIGGTIGF